MGLVAVLAWVFGLAAYTSLVERANDWRRSEIREDCYERGVVKGMRFGAVVIPYPLRRSPWRLKLKEGSKNLCTGEVYNGRWWYLPEHRTGGK